MISMNIPKISIIVPIYNAGQFLQRRIDSLLNQSLKEIEIILVLDCPTDGSDKIAESYSQQDIRIVLIYNQTNLHIGLSRNEGLRVASGVYVTFGDHDDYCELDMYEKMYRKAIETDADVVVSPYYAVTSNAVTLFDYSPSLSDAEFQSESFAFMVGGPRARRPLSVMSNTAVWSQIYKRSFLTYHKIIFQDNRKITFEDRLFLIEVYYFANKVAVLHEAFAYHIYHEENSGSKYSYRSMDVIINYLLYIHGFLDRHHILEKKFMLFSDNVLLSSYSAFRNEILHKPFLKGCRELSKVRKNEILQSSLRYFLKWSNFRQLKKYPLTKLCFLLLATRFFKRG